MKKNLILFLSILFATTLFAQNIVQWRGDNRDGKYPDKNLLKEWPAEGPELLWHFDELGEGYASLTIDKDAIYTSALDGENGYVCKLSLDGKLIWKKTYGKEWADQYTGVRSTPLLVDNDLFMMSAYGQVFSMDKNSGEINWSINIMDDYQAPNIRWGLCENFLADGDKLFVTAGASDANVIALNKNTGELIWKNKGLGEKSAYNSPVIINHNGRRIFVTHTAKSILGLNPETGELLWSHEKPNKYDIQPNTALYHKGMLFSVSGYGFGGIMFKLNEDGSEITKVWENASLDNQMGGVILHDEKIYGGGHHNRKWSSLDWNTGEVLFETKEMARGNSIFADGLIYFYDERGFIFLVEPNGAETKIISKFRVPYGTAQHWAHLVINNQKLYIRHGNSVMVYSIAAN